MRIQINDDSIADWKHALVSDRAAQFIWIGDTGPCSASPVTPLETNPPQETEGSSESSYPWLADAQDVIVVSRPMSPSFLNYVKQIRGFLPSVVTLEGLDHSLRLSSAILASPASLDVLRSMRSDNTYLFTARLRNGDMAAMACTTSIGLAGTPSHLIYENLNDKRYGRALCRALGIRVPDGAECATVAQLKAAVRLETGLHYPILVKEASEDSGAGHTAIRTEEDAARFLATFDGMPDSHAIQYVVESHLDVAPDSNFTFRIVVGKEGGITLTDLHRGWVYPPVYHPVLDESPHGLSASQLNELYAAAEKIGLAMYREGFQGTAGCDGVIDRQGVYYPILDINPRFTGEVLSTNLIQQFKPRFFHKQNIFLSNICRAATFSNMREALHAFPSPPSVTASLVILSVGARRTAHDHPASLGSLRAKVLTFGPELVALTSMTHAAAAAIHTYFCPTADDHRSAA